MVSETEVGAMRTAAEVRASSPNSEDYVAANDFLRKLRGYTGKLKGQDIKTLRGQALAGDVAGAWRGLEKLVKQHD